MNIQYTFIYALVDCKYGFILWVIIMILVKHSFILYVDFQGKKSIQILTHISDYCRDILRTYFTIQFPLKNLCILHRFQMFNILVCTDGFWFPLKLKHKTNNGQLILSRLSITPFFVNHILPWTMDNGQFNSNKNIHTCLHIINHWYQILTRDTVLKYLY